MTTFMDSNCNRISVKATEKTREGRPLVICRLVDEPTKGYIVLMEKDGAFGNEANPSSYGMACMTWFGPGERYPDADTALAACAE